MISISSIIILPESGFISFEKHLNEVVLPEAFLPNKQKHSPFDTFKYILSNFISLFPFLQNLYLIKLINILPSLSFFLLYDLHNFFTSKAKPVPDISSAFEI